MAAAIDTAALRRELDLRLAAGCYGQAQAAFEEYCRELAATVSGLPPGDARLAELEEEWRRLAETVRRQVLAGRAHLALRRASLGGGAVYAERPAGRSSWHILA